MEAHEYANLFPMLPDAELQELANDIKAHGQWVPITTYEGKILDGRNRWRACELAGKNPKTVEFSGDDALSFVIGSNLIRRHLTPLQKGLFASRAADLRLGSNRFKVDSSADEPTNKDREKAAKEFKVSTATLDRARSAEKTASPELIDAMEKGTIGAKTAEVIAMLPKERQAQVLAEGPEAVKEKAKEIRDFGGEIAPCPKPDFEYVAPPEKEAKKPRNNYRPALGREISIMAITTLQRIGDDDKELEPAYRAVIDHCNERLALNGK